MSYSFESIAQLDHSKEFALLHKKFTQFNPLKVLRVEHYEIRHSNVLAWLLDPDENHQFGSFFIRKMISRLLIISENEEKLGSIDYLPLLYSSLNDAVVHREVKTFKGRYIDLVIDLPSLHTVLVIENKYHATESESQLQDYLDYVKEAYEGYTVIPIFLTLASDAPSHPDYWSLDYHGVLEIITQHLELNKEVIADNIHDFLMYYAAIIQEELIEDDEAIEMALEVYQKHQTAIDLLYVSQHEECQKQPRFKEFYAQIDELSIRQQLALKLIYEKKRKTIDYIFKMGSNVLRQAFLSFADIEGIPQEVYHAHVKVPNFILPEWADFEAIIGKPETGYWLGHGFIIWFERTWNDCLKMNVEVGPIPYENRLKLLNALEAQGVAFRASAKLEGKKYTKIYTETTVISDWTDKLQIVEGMERLYRDDEFDKLLSKIATAIAGLENGDEQQPEADNLIIIPEKRIIPNDAFLAFADQHALSGESYRMKKQDVSFLVPLFRELETIYGSTRMKWWWHDSTFTYWFERLKDDRLKLTLELGPLFPDKRLSIVKQMEEMGVKFPVKAKSATAKYTRIFSESVVIQRWEDVNEVQQAMEKLFHHPKNQNLLKLMENLL